MNKCYYLFLHTCIYLAKIIRFYFLKQLMCYNYRTFWWNNITFIDTTPILKSIAIVRVVSSAALPVNFVRFDSGKRNFNL